MKRILPALILAAAAATGCNGGAPPRQELADLQKRIDSMERDQKIDNDRMFNTADELMKRNKGLLDSVKTLEMKVATLQASVDRLEERLKTMGASTTSDSGTGEKKNPSVDPLTRVAEVLLDLKTGKIKNEDAIAALKPFAKDAVPLLLEELKRHIADIKFAVQLEQILSKMPAADLKGPLAKALEEKTLKQSAARVVGATGDKELSKILESYTSTSDEDFRLDVGAALTQCRNVAGIRPLVQSLRSGEWSNRTIAIDLLRKVNKGLDYGFKPRVSNDENADSIKQWESWADGAGKTIFD